MYKRIKRRKKRGPMPPETRKKISEAKKGSKGSALATARRVKTTAERFVIWHSDKTRRKLSRSREEAWIKQKEKKKWRDKIEGRKRRLFAACDEIRNKNLAARA